LNDIDQIENHATLGSHYQVEIAQPYVEVNDNNLVADVSEGSAYCGGRCSLPNATLA
jgi:hypothetical protein